MSPYRTPGERASQPIHRCDPPGVKLAPKCVGLTIGDVWRCRECKQAWEWRGHWTAVKWVAAAKYQTFQFKGNK